MKKKLVVLLAVVMMFAFSASAYAATFSDVSERSVVEQDAIKKAVALGIIEGYEDGTFGPDKTITRAEFAKIAVTAAGAKETATMLEANASAFKDVRANSWYTGWINAAESLGIFKGDLNGNFRPNDTISNQEAITVLLRLLGYNDNLTGTWPVNYVTKANQIGILDDVNIVASGAAKRGDIVVMLGEALDTPIVTYDKDTNEFVYKQTTKSGSSYITLLDDSFSGSFIEVSGTNRFEPINQVRNVADKTLNWNVVGWQANLTTSVNENKVYDNTNFNGTLVVDENTAVSYNAAGLFDLEGHQGKVYYVTENDRKYARFIEVDSYVQTVTDAATKDGNKIKVLSTNYNATNDAVVDTNAENNFKNTNIKLFFNDDDQVYWAVSDKHFTDKAYYVKAMTTASARLIGGNVNGTRNKTVNMSDADTLVYADGKFVSPSDLEIGDAVVEIREGELYVKVNDASGDYTRTENALANKDTVRQHKVTIGGKKYVFLEYATTVTDNEQQKGDSDGIKTYSPVFYEEDLEVSDVTSEDVYNNNVKFLLNKDNSVAAIIVDETSTGTTLYGILVDGGGNGSWGKNMSSITLFTQEGYTVTYDLAKDCKGKPDPEDGDVQPFMGQPVAYKLNADGAIKSMSGGWKTDGKSDWTDMMSGGTAGDNKTIKVKNNAYLVTEPVTANNVTTGTRQSVSLASNVVIFEVNADNGDSTGKNKELDVSLVTRSSLLSSGDFDPVKLEGIKMLNGTTYDPNGYVSAYAKYITNTNNSVKAFAYTSANSTTKYFGVINAWKFTDSDHAGYLTGTTNGIQNSDFAVTLVGDDKIYDLNPASAAANKGGAGKFIIYTISGDEIKVLKAFGKTTGLSTYAKLVSGYNDGWIYFADPINIGLDDVDGKLMDEFHELYTNYTDEAKVADDNKSVDVYRVMTDANTVVYIIDSNTGAYREGSRSDINRNAYAYVPYINDDGYAGAVLIDEYYSYREAGSGSTHSFKTPVVTAVDAFNWPIDNITSPSSVRENSDGTLSFTVNVSSQYEVANSVAVTLNGDALTRAEFRVTKNSNNMITVTINATNMTLKDSNNEIKVTIDVVKK